ncbi:DUF3219 family protein [Piscibacillus sp. B03]|uniref:DUF3219 family protein n=1 Tax=Piscibacillus sp. B03 TaxID=3457430 RepID=UPI003FCEB736
MAQLLIDNYSIDVEQYQVDTRANKSFLSVDFKVTHEQYHDITTLLYKNDFKISLPSENLQFDAMIQTFWTSFTNLYKEGAIGDFHLELIEK